MNRNTLIIDTLPDYHRWLHHTAYEYLPRDSADHDDLVQEGYVAMWRACETFDPSQGALASWLTTAARLRMRDIAHGHGRWTGHEPTRGTRDVETTSLDAILADDPEAVLWARDVLDGVEAAYHEGEIARALDTLSTQQRRYVLARFWVGLEPSARTPEMRALIDQVPVLRHRWLWTGTSKQRGARARLAEHLAHLIEA